MNDADALVVGAGHNGLVAGFYLARAGLRVLILERRSLVGGACVTEELFPGVRVSSCSYLCYLLQRRVIDDMALRQHGLRIHPIDPWRFLPLPDGRRLLLWNDVAAARAEIARLSTADARRYPEWLAFWLRAARLVEPFLLRPPPSEDELRRYADSRGELGFLDRLRQASMKEVVGSFFESEPVQGAFIHAHDVGDIGAPGSAWCYAYIKCTGLLPPEDVGLVQGGMGGITESMRAAALAAGARIRTQTVVRRVLVEDGRATGVELEDRTVLRAPVVLSNADPKRTFLDLLDPGDLDPRFRAAVGSLQTRAAYFKFHAVTRGLPDFERYFADGRPAFDPKFLAEIKICPSVGYYERAWADAVRGRPSGEPVMEVQMPAGYDDSMSASGRHALSAWVLYAPATPPHGGWDMHAEACGERVLEVLGRYAPNLGDIVEDWSLHTPADIERRVGMTDGNIRHLDMVPDQWFWRRPLAGWAHYRTPVGGLYLCGAGTHPGGEVTGAPGHNAAQLVLEDLAVADEPRRAG